MIAVIPPTIDVEAMTLSELAESCAREMSNYRQGLPYDNHYCLEIFRRAVFERDSFAWQVLQERLTPTVLAWMRRHHQYDLACRFDREENYVAQAFERFWRATVSNQRVEFTTLAAALRYLYASLNGAILDTLRAYARPKEVPMSQPGFSGEPAIEEEESSDFIEIIQGLLPSPLERRLAFLLFHSGLKPREVLQYCPQEFHSIKEIYRMRRSIVERLMRNADYIQWRLQPNER